jgi:hypothetical protein
MEKLNTSNYVSCEGSIFVGTIYDLSQPIYLNFDSHEKVASESPDGVYVIDVEYRTRMLVDRFQSLNLVYQLLAFEELPVRTSSGVISRRNWIRIVLDVLLSRFTSARDCAYLLIAEVFEIKLNPRSISRGTLKNSPLVPTPFHELIDNIAEAGRQFRDERDRQFHRGEERALGDDPITYYAASNFEAFGHEVQGNDMFGNPIDLKAQHRKIVDDLRNEFTVTAKSLESSLLRLLDNLYPIFIERFRAKMISSGNNSKAAEHIIWTNEYYNQHPPKSSCQGDDDNDHAY